MPNAKKVQEQFKELKIFKNQWTPQVLKPDLEKQNMKEMEIKGVGVK